MIARGSVFRRCGCTEIREGKRVQLGQSCRKLRRANGSWANHGTWAYAVRVNGPDGKRTMKRQAGYDTKEAAQEALDAVRNDAARGFVSSDKLTVGDYLCEWVSHKTNLKSNTLDHYQRYVENVFVPYLGHLRLRDLRPAHVQKMFQDLRSSRGTLGRSSAQRMRAVLRSALTDALRASLVTTNAAALTKIDSARTPRAAVWTKAREADWRSEVDRLVANDHTRDEARRMANRPSSSMVWTPAHLGQFLDSISDHDLYALFWIVAHCGLRRGEVCALRWADLNDDATLSIERQLVTTPTGVIEDTPKSEASGRTVAIGKAGVDVLKAHRVAQAERHMAWGLGQASGYMFTQYDGKPYNPNRITKLFRELVAEADLPPIRLHDLRHTAASLMLASGQDMKVVSTVLGHSDITVTANIYASVYEDAAHAAVEAMTALIPRAR